MSLKGNSILAYVRNFLLGKKSKEFLTFLLFLFLSAFFWLITNLNDVYEREVVIPLSIYNVPKSIVVADGVDSIRINVRDKGFNLAYLMYAEDEENQIRVDFNRFAGDLSLGHGVVSQQELMRQCRQLLTTQGKVLQIKPEHLDFYYSKGISHKLPVRLSSSIDPKAGYYVSNITIKPDSVLVYASEESFDTLQYVYTDRLHITDFAEEHHTVVSLAKIRGAKLATQKVQVTLSADMLTDAMFEVPIIGINLPSNMQLRCFPAKAKVSFKTGMGKMRAIKAADFTVVADYEEFGETGSSKCTLHILDIPHGVSDVKLVTSSVDYLLEKQ